MKTVHYEFNSREQSVQNDGSVFFHCHICGKGYLISSLLKLKKIRFKIHEISPVFDQLCLDCTHCGMTTYHTQEYAFSALKLIFDNINPDFAKTLTIPKCIRDSKAYFDFLETLKV